MLSVERLSIRLAEFQLSDITFSVPEGGYCVLLGSSGAGKTVILELLAGLLTPAGGRVALRGRDLARVPIGRRGIGLVYQDHALFPHLSVEANIGYSLSRLSSPLRRQRVHALAEEVGAAHLLPRRPGTLSLGEAQRVALARTLATDPAVLLLDEPLASLDAHARASIRALLRRINRAGRTIVHVTHDFEEAVALAGSVAVLEDGRIVQQGTPDEVFHHPRSEFVARFSGIRNFLPGRIVASDEESLFEAGPLQIHVALDAPCGAGFLLLRAEDIILSRAQPEGSARNCFRGIVVDIEPVAHGADVEVLLGQDSDPAAKSVGCRVVARVTRASLAAMSLTPGEPVWVSWKSTAGRFLSEENAV